MVPKGEWDASTAYVRLDVVLYNGSSWVAIADSTGQVPAEGSTYWQLLASGVDITNYYTKTQVDVKMSGKQDTRLEVEFTESTNIDSGVVTYTASKNMAEIMAAMQDGRDIIAKMGQGGAIGGGPSDNYDYYHIFASKYNALLWGRLTNDANIELFVQQQSALTRHVIALQERLVSGASIKTVNGVSLLGSGDVTIAAGEDGKSAYQSYLDTTTDNPPKSEAEWVASLKGADGHDGVSLGEVAIVNNLTEGGSDKVLSAEMGKELGKRAVVDIVSEGVIRVTGNRALTLDDVCYEGKTYRQIFEGESTFLYDAEETFAAARVEEYRNKSISNIPTRNTLVVDSGEHSIYCHQVVGTSSCLRQASNNTKLMQAGKTYYIALRINQLSLTFGSGQTRNPIAVCESDVVCVCNEATNGWITLSGTWTNPFSSTQGKLYFGLFGGSDGEAYLDSVVAVPMHMFVTAPNKEQMDSFYNTYVQIKKHTANSSNSTTTTITSSPEMVNRSLLVNYGFTDLECMQEFMRELNVKAHKIGMTDSTFSNPYGGDKYGYNWTTVEDMMKMIVYATSYPRVLDYMSQNTQVDLPIYGVQARTEVFPTTTNNFNILMQGAYEAVHGSGTMMPYYVNARKGAGWGNLDNKDATSRTRGMVGTAVVDGHNVAFCIFGCNTAYPNANTDSRIYKGIVDLLDICKAHFDGTTIGAQSYIGYFNYAIAIELPASQNECHKNNINIDVIYKKSVVDNDVETKFHTASAIKVLTAMVLFDTLGYDLHQVIEVNSYDENYDNTFWNPNDSGSFEGHAGDKCTLSTALYAILGWSNGVFTLAAARAAGAKMLYNKLLKGIS